MEGTVMAVAKVRVGKFTLASGKQEHCRAACGHTPVMHYHDSYALYHDLCTL